MGCWVSGADCPAGTWNTSLLSRIAPTAHDDESRADPRKNPDLGHLLRGTVHDTTARRMGGVAGDAGVFATAHDVAIYAQALLDRLAGRPSDFPLTQATLELMTSPQQPGHTPDNSKRRTMRREAPLATKRTQRIRFSPRDTPRSGGRTCGASAGISIPPVHAARHGLSHRELRPHRLHRNLVVDRPGFRHLRGAARRIRSTRRAAHRYPDLRGEVATAAARALGLYGSGGKTARSSLKVLIVDGISPVAAPAPATIGEGAHGGVSRVQDSGVGAVAVEVWRGVLRLEGAGPIDLRIEQRIEVDGATGSRAVTSGRCRECRGS